MTKEHLIYLHSLTLLTHSSFKLQRTSSVRLFRDSKWDARNLHCLTSSNECTSEAAIALNVCDLRVDSWSDSGTHALLASLDREEE